MDKKYKFTLKDTNCAKALTIIMMMVHHLFTFEDKMNVGVSFTHLYTFADGKTLEYFAGDFCKLCVALFIMLSGYGVYISLHKTNDYTQTISQRIKKVYLNFWKFFIVFIPIGLFINPEKITSKPIDWVKNFFALETSFNDEWWFLTQYLIMILLIPFIFKWLDREHSNPWKDFIYLVIFNVLVGTMLLSVVNSVSFFESFRQTYFWLKMSTCINMIPMFALGAFLAKYNVIEVVTSKLKHQVYIKGFAVLALVLTIILRENWLQRNQWGWDRLDFLYAAVLILVFKCLFFELKGLQNVFNVIGRQSMGMWLIHSFFCYYYFPKFIYAPQNPILILLLLFVVSFVVSWVITDVFQKVYQVILVQRGKMAK